MADIECKAIALRKQRFALADKIRFTQDTILKHTSVTDSARLELNLLFYNKEKEKLVSESLLLADTIRSRLDSLRIFIFKNSDDKNQFDQKLKEALAERGCNE